MEERKHHHMSPSAANALIFCGHYRSTPSGEGKRTDDKLGNEMHEVTQDIFKGKSPEKPEILSYEQYEKCETAAKEVAHFFEKHWPKGEDFDQKAVNIEHKISLLNDEMEEMSYGHTDFDYGVVMCDLKSGLDFHDDPAKYMPQMRIYALMLMRMYNKQKAHCLIWFISKESGIELEITREEAEATFEAVRKKFLDKDAAPQPNIFCTLCRRITNCPAINKLRGLIVTAFNGLENVDPNNLTDPVMWAKLLTAEKLLRKQCDIIKKMGLQFAQDGNDIPYFRIKKKSGKSRITNVETAYELSGLSKDAFLACCAPSIAKMSEKLYEAAGGKGGSMSAKKCNEEMKGRLDSVIEIGEPSEYLEQVTER